MEATRKTSCPITEAVRDTVKGLLLGGALRVAIAELQAQTETQIEGNEVELEVEAAE
ncbi:MAG: hypothetical protein IPN40_09160 [Uliginosibacterium sp.]|nr:hypothetical protein [Uliginosibacterium sp.]